MAVTKRIKVSAAYNAFEQSITKLQKFDDANQTKFSEGQINRGQIYLLTESVFFNAFRAYENFIREVFLLYCLGKQSQVKPKVMSYLSGKNFSHTEELLKSSMPFLDWNSPETIITRSEVYLKNGHPIRLAYTTNLNDLKSYKNIRNHIAHDSVESESKYIKVVRTYNNGTTPLTIPSPGEYLTWSSKVNPSNYLLLDFFELIKKIANDIT